MGNKRAILLAGIAGVILGVALSAAALAVFVWQDEPTVYTSTEVMLLDRLALPASPYNRPANMNLIAEPHRWLALDPATLGEPIPINDSNLTGSGTWVIPLDRDNHAAAAPFADGLSPRTGFSYLAGTKASLEALRQTEGIIHLGVVTTTNNISHGEILIAISESDKDPNTATLAQVGALHKSGNNIALDGLNAKAGAFANSQDKTTGAILRELAQSPSLRLQFESFINTD